MRIDLAQAAPAYGRAQTCAGGGGRRQCAPGKTEPPEGALSDRKFRIFSRLFRWLGIAAVGFAAFLLVSNIVFWIRADSAVGIVTRQEVMKHTGSPSVYREPAYAPVITFQTAGGETVEVVSDVGFGEHFAYTDGDEVNLLYLS